MSAIKRYGRTSSISERRKKGRGFVNSLINKLPFELHLPGGYQYCGPGTKLRERLARKDPGINKLDIACKRHDIQYSKYPTDLTSRHKADKELEYAAWDRVKSKDAGIGERAAALLVTNVMKTKRRFGMGCNVVATKKKRKNHPKKTKNKMRKVAFGAGVVHKVRNVLRNAGGDEFVTNNRKKATTVALQAARKYLKAAGGKKKIRTPRIIPIPKVGGILPLIPIFAGLSALGSLAGAVSGITKAVNSAKASRVALMEANRHNKKMEAIALGKSGSGIFLKPYRKGLGLYLKPYNSKN